MLRILSIAITTAVFFVLPYRIWAQERLEAGAL
jgi:hypothetical protein